MQLPSYEQFDAAIEQLLRSFKYFKLNKWLLAQLKKVINWLVSLIERLLNQSMSDKSHGVAKVVLVVLITMISVMVIGLVVYWIRHRKNKQKGVTILGENLSADTSVESVSQRGMDYAQAGRYREAIRMQFIAVLFFLHQEHVLYHDATLTGQEMIMKLKQERFIAIQVFEEMTETFNKTWYGVAEVEQGQFGLWQQLEQAFWQKLRETQKPERQDVV